MEDIKTNKEIIEQISNTAEQTAERAMAVAKEIKKITNPDGKENT